MPTGHNNPAPSGSGAAPTGHNNPATSGSRAAPTEHNHPHWKDLGSNVAPRTQFNVVTEEHDATIRDRIAQNAITSLVNQLRTFGIEVDPALLHTNVQEDRALALAYLIIKAIRRIPTNQDTTEIQQGQIRAMEQRAILLLQGILGSDFPVSSFLRMGEVALLGDRLLNAGNTIIQNWATGQVEGQAALVQEMVGRIETARTTIHGALNTYNQRRETLAQEADRLQVELLGQARELVTLMDRSENPQFESALLDLRTLL